MSEQTQPETNTGDENHSDLTANCGEPDCVEPEPNSADEPETDTGGEQTPADPEVEARQRRRIQQ
ncbi:MAG: hypothetical protein AAGI44_03080, partial [Pseudomonadota bacterium]